MINDAIIFVVLREAHLKWRCRGELSPLPEPSEPFFTTAEFPEPTLLDKTTKIEPKTPLKYVGATAVSSRFVEAQRKCDQSQEVAGHVTIEVRNSNREVI